MMEIYTYFVLASFAWFFFWLVPRVEDGRLEEIIAKIEKRIKKQ